MASIIMYPVVIFAMLIATIRYIRHLGVLGMIIVLALGCLGIFISLSFTDVLLTGFGFEQGFPSGDTGYYTYQGALFVIVGTLLMGAYIFINKELQNQQELGKTFLFSSSVMLLTGVFDLMIDILFRMNEPFSRLIIGVLLFLGLMVVFVKYKDKIFPKKENDLGNIVNVKEKPPKKKKV
jgi:drug/metabolite transporter (DMT)-like permease